MLEVTTDAQCVDVRGTSITVGSASALEAKAPAARTDACSSSGRIGSLAVVPSGDKDDEVAIRVVTGVGKSPEACIDDGYVGGCIVARRILRFLPHTPLVLPVHMGIDCLDVPCGATQTCFKGQCVPAKIDCTDSGGCMPQVGDGGTTDAGIDGSGGAAGSAGSGGVGGLDAGDAATDALTCTAPQADCNNNAADGCETDLNTDALHCGQCGRDCQGGTCNQGMCSAVTMWSAANARPRRIALDATHIYFLEFTNGILRRIPKAGGSVEILAAAKKQGTNLAVDSTHVYFVDDFELTVNRVPKTGGTVEQLATLSGAATWLTLDSANVYVSESAAQGKIYKLSKAGGAPTALASSLWPAGVAVSATHAYWPNFQLNAGLWRVPLSGGTAEPVDPTTSNGQEIAVDAMHVYWTVLNAGANKGELRKLPLAGGNVEILATGQAGPRGLALDASHAYWTNADDGTVKRIALDGSDQQSATLIDSSGTTPVGIAVDATSVYWVDEKAGLLRRITK